MHSEPPIGCHRISSRSPVSTCWKCCPSQPRPVPLQRRITRSSGSREGEDSLLTRLSYAKVRPLSVGFRFVSTATLACGLVTLPMCAAAQTAVCSDTPAEGERVECAKDSTSTDDIEILLEGVDIDIATTAVNTHAVRAKHEGSGDIDIEVTHDLNDSGEVVRSAIATSGKPQAYAIYGEHTGTGTVDISVSTSTIGTTGRTAHGVHARHYGTGLVRFDVTNSRIDTEKRDAHGIFAVHHSTGTGDDANANVLITATSNRVVTAGESAHGIRGRSDGKGDVTITTTSNTITTKGKEAIGIYGYHRGEGDIFITSTQDAITTENKEEGDNLIIATGILAWHQRGNGDTNIRVVGGSISTVGNYSAGIIGQHALTSYDPVTTKGAVDIDVKDTVIDTTGKWSSGIFARHSGSGAVRVATRGGQRITTTGAAAHGILAYHDGTGEDRSIDIMVGGTIDARGKNADGVRVGTVSSGNAVGAAALDEGGYRRHTVTVNGGIKSATGAGVFLAGGGKLFIGPAGRIDADSGSAILATGDTPADDMEDPAIKPKLLVGMQLDGRRLTSVLGDSWIVNDGGETTILVNNVKLHDGATGVVPGAVAAYGAWDVTIRDAGVRVTDRTDTNPESWTVSEPAMGVVADRDFSAEDFVETYAPRAAIYEALPGFLLRLNAPGSGGTRVPPGEATVWTRFTGGRGAFEPERASIGAKYRFGHSSLEAGLDVPFGDGVTGLASIHSLRGFADVSASTGGGRIDASGHAMALGLSVNNVANGAYASGRLSYAEYTLGLASDRRGPLGKGIWARGLSLDLDVGLRATLGDSAFVAPRVKVTASGIDVDDFTDATGSRVSVVDASRQTRTLGIVAESWRWFGQSGGTLGLRGSLDLERSIGKSGTSVLVSGKKLYSAGSWARLNLALGGSWRCGGLAIDTAISVLGIGSDDTQLSGHTSIAMHF